jgi:broad specificity phosphatase PhoE
VRIGTALLYCKDDKSIAMKPQNIYIIRHAESQSNVNRKLHETVPDWKVELTEHGHKQAIAAGNLLAKEIGSHGLGVYVSAYRRTRQTWEGIHQGLYQVNNMGTRVNFVYEDPRLREQDYGNLLSAEEYNAIDPQRIAYGPFYYRIPDGESGCDVYVRCSSFLDTLYRDFEKPDFPSNVLIVTHGFTLRVLLMRWFHWTPEHFHRLKNPHNCQRFDFKLNMLGKYDLVTPCELRAEGECSSYNTK